MRTLLATAATALLATMWATPATAGLAEKTFSARSYPNSDNRTYAVYTPSTYDGNTPLPLVMILHGCKQTHNTVLSEQGWMEAAEKNGYILVAPFITTYDGLRNENCWGFWDSFDKEIHAGGGEVEDLHQIAVEVEQSYRVDPDRRYIGGLSSGGFMANTAAVAHNEYWAAAFVMAGGGYKETASVYTASSYSCANPYNRSGTFKSPEQILATMNSEMNSSYSIPLLLMHSANDCTVGAGDDTPGNIKWGGLNGNREAWLQRHAGSRYGDIQKNQSDCAADSIPCTWTQYSLDGSRSLVETVLYTGIKNTGDGKGHYFPGGKSAGEYTYTTGPRTRDIAWNFFARHSRNTCTQGCPVPPAKVTALRSSTIGDSSVTLQWDANTDADLVGYFVYRGDTRLNDTAQAASTLTDSGLLAGTTYTYTVRAYDSENLQGPASDPLTVTTGGAPQCLSVSTSNDQHVAAGRATVSYSYNWLWQRVASYKAKGSNDSLGSSGSTTTTLYYTQGSGSYSTTPCPGSNPPAACHTASNSSHQSAGRATYEFIMGTGMAYLAKGSRANLGLLGTLNSSLRESQPGYWDQVTSCP